MTLNITLVTPERIYQSADFRLTQPGAGPLTYDSMKAVHLAGERFYGALTYTGIGEWEGRSTAEYAVEWLAGGFTLRLSGLAEALEARAGPWLEHIERATGRQYPHTFVIAGFEEGAAGLAMVSNFETATDQRPTRRAGLVVTYRRDVDKPLAVVTGQRRSVDRTTRRALERAATRYAGRPQRVRQLLAEANATAARLSISGEMISVDCAVFSLDRGGAGHLTLTGPKSVQWHSTLTAALPGGLLEVARSLGISQPRLVGATTATNLSQQYALEPWACDVQPASPPKCRYEIVELAPPARASSWCRGLNNRSTVLGASATANAPGEALMWTWHDGHFVDLGVAVTNSGAMAINDSDEVGGAYSQGVGTLRPFISRGGVLTPLMPGAGVDAAVNALAPDGTAVGYISTSVSDRGQLHHRPATWSPTGDLEVIDDIPAEWGYAAAVNGAGRVLLSLHRGVQTITGIYSDGRLTLVDGSGLPGLIPIGLDDRSRVLCFFNTDAGAVACVYAEGVGLHTLGLGSGWYPSGISRGGWIAGSYRASGFERPWVLPPDGVVERLPYMPDHWCRPAAVNDAGDVALSCSADAHQHAVYLQRPRTDEVLSEPE